MGGLSSTPILSLLQSESLVSFRFLRLDNTSCQSNHSLYIVPNFEGLKAYAGTGKKNQISQLCLVSFVIFKKIKTC